MRLHLVVRCVIIWGQVGEVGLNSSVETIRGAGNNAQKRPIGGLVDTFRHTLDPKKRLTIPSEWRDALGNPTYVYIMPSPTEDCLELIPVELMERTLARYQDADLFDDDADADAQAIAAHSQMLKVDAQGRIRIGDELLSHAGIMAGVTMIGGMRKAKLWASELKPASQSGKLDLTEFRAVAAKRKMLAREGAKA